jgi:hypothetical protein
MKPEQIDKLKALSERLTDVLLFDADPENWVGVGIPASQLSREERGDAYWCRRVATASVSVLMRVESLIADVGAKHPAFGDDEGDLDTEIAKAEKEAARLLKRLNNRESDRKAFVEAATTGRRKAKQ